MKRVYKKWGTGYKYIVNINLLFVNEYAVIQIFRSGINLKRPLQVVSSY